MLTGTAPRALPAAHPGDYTYGYDLEQPGTRFSTRRSNDCALVYFEQTRDMLVRSFTSRRTPQVALGWGNMAEFALSGFGRLEEAEALPSGYVLRRSMFGRRQRRPCSRRRAACGLVSRRGPASRGEAAGRGDFVAQGACSSIRTAIPALGLCLGRLGPPTIRSAGPGGGDGGCAPPGGRWPTYGRPTPKPGFTSPGVRVRPKWSPASPHFPHVKVGLLNPSLARQIASRGRSQAAQTSRLRASRTGTSMSGHPSAGRGTAGQSRHRHFGQWRDVFPGAIPPKELWKKRSLRGRRRVSGRPAGRAQCRGTTCISTRSFGAPLPDLTSGTQMAVLSALRAIDP